MRAVAIVGPSQSGKSTLVDGLVSLEEARSQSLGLPGGTCVRPFEFMDDAWLAIEVPGGHDALAQVGPVLATCDAVILCVPPQTDAAVLAAPYLRITEQAALPTFIFINKMDTALERVADIVASLQAYCSHAIVMRQVPIRVAGEVTGVVDLISERAWEYREHRRSALIELPATMAAREQEARSELLEAFADFDDTVLEQIIEDRLPATEEVYSVATRVLQHHDLIPALLGAASHGNGLLRLMKSLRHEVPKVSGLRSILDLPAGAEAIASLADHLKHLGKLVLIRALKDGISSGTRLGGDTLGGLISLDGRTPQASALRAGEFALAIKSDHISPARVLTPDQMSALPEWTRAHPPIVKRIAHAIHEREDGKLSIALAHLAEIDPGLVIERDENTGSLIVGVQGEQHLKALIERLDTAFGIGVECEEVPVPMRETIRSATKVHHRHRKQSGGAGQFADIVIEVAPAKSGSGFSFEERIKGGVVPRNYIPSVEAGAREALAKGPAGFRVVDLSVTLLDGKSHSVDSSDFAFKTAGLNGTREALEKAGTVILQPIMMVEIHVPSIFTGGLVQLLSSLKGQVLKFEAHPEAAGWDVFSSLLPMEQESKLSRAIGGATRGTAWFECSLDHYERAALSSEPA